MNVATTTQTAEEPQSDPAQRETFIAAWNALFAAFRRAKGRSGVAGEAGADLTLSQYHVLAALGDHDHLRIGELATAAGIAAPTATRMVDALERKGVVARNPSPDDRRSVTVSLTPEGRELVISKRNLIDERLGKLHESLSDDERAQSTRLLQRLAEAIEEL